MDAWQQVQLLRLGPSELFMRHFRLEMWPDRSNSAGKQLRKLKQKKDEKALQVDNFRNASVAVQGLSAYERLVFAKDSKANQFTGDAAGKYQCQLLQAISISVETISADLLKEWQGVHYKTLTSAGKDNDTFATDKEVATVFINELSTQLQFVLEKKFKRPLDGKYFKGIRAESWRSGRSIRNIVINIESAQQVYQLGFKAHIRDKALQKKLQQQFKQALAVGKALEMPLQQAVNEKADALAQWNQQVVALKNTLSIELPKAVDIVLGFNSLDGD
jgi:predicted lipoprotein